MGSTTTHWTVSFDVGAVRDFEDVKNKGDRKAVFTVLDKLQQLGPRLAPPHMKPLKGESGLNELRPRQGGSAMRPIYAQIGNEYVILAVASDHEKDFARAISDAHERLKARSNPSDV